MRRPDRGAVAASALALVLALAGCSGRATPARSTTASRPPTALTTGADPTTTASTTTPPPSDPPPSDPLSATTPTATPAPVNDPVAQRLFARSKAAVATVRTMRITGTTSSGGATATIDLRFGVHATAGRITRGGYTFDLIFVGHEFYFRAPVAFLRAQYRNQVPAAVKRTEGKYVVSAVNSTAAAPFAAFANRAALLAGVYDPHPNLRHGPNRTIDGVLCASLLDPGRGAFYVRAGNALPVRLDATGTGGALTFSQLNQVIEPVAPPRGQAVDSQGNPV